MRKRKMPINSVSDIGPATCGRPISPTKEALQSEVEHFVECVSTGASPISNGLSGLRVIEALEAASRSIADHGAPVRLKQQRSISERVKAIA